MSIQPIKFTRIKAASAQFEESKGPWPKLNVQEEKGEYFLVEINKKTHYIKSMEASDCDIAIGIDEQTNDIYFICVSNKTDTMIERFLSNGKSQRIFLKEKESASKLLETADKALWDK